MSIISSLTPEERTPFLSFEKDLYRKIKAGEWDKAVNLYRENFEWAHGRLLIKKLSGTVLHFAVSHGRSKIVEQLVEICEKKGHKEVLKIRDMQGNVPLHLAASTGSLRKCICIAKADPSLGNERNKEGESPLFSAAILGRTEIFLCLRSICKNELHSSYFRKNGGETILHCAIKRNCWDLAYQLLLLNHSKKKKLLLPNGGLATSVDEKLATFVDEKGNTPLHFLADKPSAFKSGCRLGWWSSIIYYCIAIGVPQEIDPRQLIERCKEKKHDFIQSLWTTIRVGNVCDKGKKADEETPESSNVSPKSGHEGSQAKSEDQKHYWFWKYCCAPIMIIKFVCRTTVYILGFEEIKKIKKTHMLSVEIMKLIMKPVKVEQYSERGRNPLLSEHENDFNILDIPDRDLDCSLRPSVEMWKNSQPQVNEETSILSAAKNGIIEMVEGILDKYPMAIHDETRKGKNIVLLAAEYRQTQVYELFRKGKFQKQSLFQKLDNEGNSALHLAATPSEQKSGLIPGAALQMQWEIKWYEHIKNSLPPGFLHLLNNKGKSSGEIFKENHKDLVEKGGKWLSSTSKACSVVAGLFVTVAFNMSTTVPGGVNQEGTPNLENQMPFYIFAISSYVSFYSSLLAVIMFLAILTSGYKESSFRSTLPIKLLLGLTAFYGSIVSTSISFSAGHFFIVKDKLKYAAFPVYSGVLLLLIFFAIAGFPMYFHLTWAIFKKVPHHQYRITRAGFHLKH